ncbi:MAG: cytochrome c [Burkholderiaceae bacterium]
MKPNRFQIATLMFCVLLIPNASNANGVAERGQLLYENQCTSCHDTSVNNRIARRATDYDGIIAQVRRWSVATSSGFTDQDVNDVATYLNLRYYRFLCPTTYCNRTQVSPESSQQSKWQPGTNEVQRNGVKTSVIADQGKSQKDIQAK